MQLEKFERIVSSSYQESGLQRNPESRVFLDLSLFWEIVEASIIGELPQTTKPYFGTSLTSYRQSHHSEEVLRTRLALPEPTRITSDVNRLATNGGTAPAPSLPNLGGDLQYSSASYLPVNGDEASILAQDYFALGEDLVGNLDDWWNPR